MSHSLLEQIVAATAGEYALIGELGENGRGTALLARDAAEGQLVVLFVPAGAESLEVLAGLSEELPANAGRCTACGYAPMLWLSHCPNCQRSFVFADTGASRIDRDAVQAATGHVYDLEGEIAHLAGGSLFFVRDRVDRRLVALAGRADAGGEQLLEAVWEAVEATVPAADGADGAAAGTASLDPDGLAADGHVPALATGDTAATGVSAGYPPPLPPRPARRRRWVPVAALAALVAVGGGTWALWRGLADPPAAASDATPAERGEQAAVSAPPVGAGGTDPAGAGAPRDVPASDGPDARPQGGAAPTPQGTPATPVIDPAESARRRVADSLRRAERAPAVVQLAGEPPAGWSWRVDGRPGPASGTVRLRPGREHVIQLDAPGYCPDVLRLTPAPGVTQAWTPRLRGKPMIGDC